VIYLPGQNRKLQGLINTEHLAADSVTAEKIVAGAVNADFTGDTTPADGSITNEKLAPDLVKTATFVFSAPNAAPPATRNIDGAVLPSNAKIIKMMMQPGPQIIFANPDDMANLSIGTVETPNKFLAETAANDNIFLDGMTDLTIARANRVVNDSGQLVVTNSAAMLGALDLVIYVQYIE
jgi:hypothetical protein